MNAKETISKIANLLNVELAEETQEVALESVKLENGTVLQAEKFEAGEAVFIQTEDESVALPIGEYELEDGRMLVVAEEGVIAELRAAGEEVVEEEMAEEEEVKEEEMAYATKEELGAAMDELKGMIEEVKQMMNPKEEEEEMSAEEQVSEEATEEVEMSAQEPAAKPIKANPEASVQKDMMKFAENGRKSTLDRVLAKISQR